LKELAGVTIGGAAIAAARRRQALRPSNIFSNRVRLA
jgi:hypothetical protein